MAEEIIPTENLEQTKTVNQKIGLDKEIFYLSVACVLITFVYIFAITFIPIPKENVRYGDICLGFLLGTLVGTIITYYFGSSSSSKSKEEAMTRLLEKK